MRCRTVVLQSTTSDCGPASLAMVVAALRRPVPFPVLRRALNPGRSGVNALDLRDGAKPYGIRGRGLRINPDQVASLPLPAIAHWQGNHYVVVESVSRRWVRIVDPAVGRRRLGPEEFRQSFTGLALTFEIEGPSDVEIPPALPPLWRRVLLPAVLGHRRELAVTGLYSVLLTLLGVALPVTTARVVDAIAASRSLDVVGGLGILALALLAAGIALGRGRALVRLQMCLGRDLATRVVRQLMRAPYRFFEQRGTGDLVERVASTEVLREVLASQLFTAILDGVLALGYVIVVLCVDPVLGAASVAVAAVQLVPLISLSSRTAQLQREELVADARVSSSLVEAVSGIATVKAAGVEMEMERRWERLHDVRLDAAARRGRVVAWGDTVAAVVRVAAPVLLLVTAGSRTASGSLSAGEALGLAALASAALVPIATLSEHIRTVHFLGSLLGHLSDILDAAPEQEQESPGEAAGQLVGAIELAVVGFRYDGRGPWAVRDVDLRIAAGQKVAIVGRSGSGKSTLAKLLVGLYRPEEGTLRFDGRDVASVDLPWLRRQVGVVLQEPFLFAGTVRDNIALARQDASLEQVIAAARLAAVHDDIQALPYGYDTVLAEEGSGLSGGQRQRLALARALLVEPAVLVLDEATSHLDIQTEALIEESLRTLRMTRIVIAHRLSTVEDAELVVRMEGGRVVATGRPDEVLADLATWVPSSWSAPPATTGQDGVL